MIVVDASAILSGLLAEGDSRALLIGDDVQGPATYVALAELLGCPLATGDHGIAGAAGIRCEVVAPPT